MPSHEALVQCRQSNLYDQAESPTKSSGDHNYMSAHSGQEHRMSNVTRLPGKKYATTPRHDDSGTIYGAKQTKPRRLIKYIWVPLSKRRQPDEAHHGAAVRLSEIFPPGAAAPADAPNGPREERLTREQQDYKGGEEELMRERSKITIRGVRWSLAGGNRIRLDGMGMEECEFCFYADNPF